MTNDNNDYEITFKRQPPKERVPLYKLSVEELFHEYEQQSSRVFDPMRIDPLTQTEKDAILNPYRDEIMRRMGE